MFARRSRQSSRFRCLRFYRANFLPRFPTSLQILWVCCRCSIFISFRFVYVHFNFHSQTRSLQTNLWSQFRQDFRITPYIYYACRIINYVCGLLFLKTIAILWGIEYIHRELVLPVWIKQDLIARFRALSRALALCLLASSLLSLAPFFSLFRLPIFPREIFQLRMIA